MKVFTTLREQVLLVVVFMLIFLQYAASENVNKLKLVQVLFRHGDRSPVFGYPNDNYTLADWLKLGAQGYGQLTFKGMKQHYELGQWFRQSYTNITQFMHSNYTRAELVVRSTDTERTLMSAYCNLAGFFPPDEKQDWWPAGANIHWQPIPVHTVPADIDNLLDTGAPCPMADELFKREQQTKAFKKKAQDNKDLFAFLSNKTGRPHESLDILWETVDTLFCEDTNNFTLPKWTNQKWPKPNSTQTVYELLLALQSWEFDLRFGEPDQKARLRGGPLLKEMLANMKQNINNESLIKFYMYSAHDNTVMALLHALKMSNHEQPPYTATVIVELYSLNHTNDHAVKVLYRNESDNDPYPMIIPGCKTVADNLCPYDQFVKLTKSMVPGDWHKECQIPEPEDKGLDERYIIGIGVGAGLAFVCILVVIVIVIKKKKANNPAPYYSINEET